MHFIDFLKHITKLFLECKKGVLVKRVVGLVLAKAIVHQRECDRAFEISLVSI